MFDNLNIYVASIATVNVKGTDEAIKINFINRGIELIEDALAK